MSFKSDIDEKIERKESRLAKAKEMIRLASDLEAPDHVKDRLEKELQQAYEDLGYSEESIGGFRDR